MKTKEDVYMEIVSFIITIIVGFAGTAIFGSWLNWPDAGAIFAIATMGSILLWNIRHKKEND